MNRRNQPQSSVSGRATGGRWAPGVAVAAAAIVGASTLGVVASGPAGAIIQGEETTVAENPWQVALTADDIGQYCGGSLISDRVVLTAGHCVILTPASEITVRAGVTDLATSDGQSRGVTAVVEHAPYETLGVGDLAMLVLDEPFDPSELISTLPLATADEEASATTARLTGWGLTDQDLNYHIENVLRVTDLPLVSDAECTLDITHDGELCAGGAGANACYGDSGGPLTIETDRGRALVGVASWGDDCDGTIPGAYAEVTKYLDWVNERVAEPDAPEPDRLFADGINPHDNPALDVADEPSSDNRDAEQPAVEPAIDTDFEEALAARLDQAGIDYEWVDEDGERWVELTGVPDDEVFEQFDEILLDLFVADGGEEDVWNTDETIAEKCEDEVETAE